MKPSAYLLKHVHAFGPEDLGIVDIAVAGTKIIDIGKDLDYTGRNIKVIDLEGAFVIPGLIDQHVHLIGGGGEDGLASRVPPIKVSDCVSAGVTTLVGVLGTDGVTRTVQDLLAKTKSLNEYGLTAFCLTGSYQVPSPTITGSVEKDIVFIQEVIGVKLAISDHRCSIPTKEEIIRLASEARLGGLIGKKAGEVHIHVGSDPRGIQDIFDIAETTPLPVSIFHPTHMGGHLDQALKFTTIGGYADITTGTKSPEKVASLLHAGANEHLVTMSSDSNGSIPVWNDHKQIIGMHAGHISLLHENWKRLVDEQDIPFATALRLVTENPAKALGFVSKGCLAAGYDADLVVLDDKKDIRSVMAGGTWLSEDGKQVKIAMYEGPDNL
ncbi:MAG: beta-aspartyl-peptidase [Spirochaetia bacterium]|nr:beta-aspartyl-peptidase [Spirochaetia bacterium]